MFSKSVKILISLPWLLVLVSCPAPSLSGSDSALIAATRAAWASSELPRPRDCSNVEVVRHGSKPAYVKACLELRPTFYKASIENSAGCVTTSIHGAVGKTWYTIRLAPGSGTDPTAVIHEMCHVLTACSGLYPDMWDSGHTDPRIWKAVGGAASVQWKAENSLRDD